MLVVVLVLQAALPGAEALALVARGAQPIEVREGRVTAVIVESSLLTLLRSIARQGGVEIVLHASLEGTISVTFRDVPLEEALRRILRTTNAVFIYSQRSSARAGAPQARLSEIHVYPGSPSGATSAPSAVRDAEPTTASATTKNRLTADATKDLLDARSRISQKRAATTLGRTYDAKNVGPLAQALAENEDPTVRLSAVKALGKLRNEQAVGPLGDVLLADPEFDVREATARALGKTWSATAVSPLVQALQQDSSALVRDAAARALGNTWDEAAVDPLIQALTSDPNPRVRESAARALGVIGDSRAESAVARALSDAHPWVREQAAAVLTVLGRR
jgi:hypothetical protein